MHFLELNGVYNPVSKIKKVNEMLYFMGTKMNEIQILSQNFSSILSAEEQLLVFKNDFPHFHRIIQGGLCI